MALHVQGKDITQIFVKNRTISAIYKAGVLVWEAVRSCFGSGMWVLAKPWLGKEAWRRGKKNI